MTSKTGVSIHKYNGMKGRLVRALNEIDRIKGIDRSYANLATFILDHLESKEDRTVISQEIPEMPSEEEIIMQKPSLTNIFIDNMLENAKIDTNGEGNRYREEVYDIANMVRSNSLKVYEMIKDIFCFPSEKSLDTQFSESTKNTISFITDINLINEIINQYRKNICNENDVIPAILGVDACSFDRLFNKNKKYAFVFYLQPVNPAYPCLPLHITPHQNGFANSEIIQKIVLINHKLEDEGIKLIGVSTDGDPNYNEVNETTFRIYEDYLKLGKFDDAYAAYSNDPNLKYFGDLLHILKLARSRILTTYVTVRVDSLEYSFTACDIEPILQLGPALTDITKTGKMRDCYTQQLFTMENLQKLIDAEMFGAAVYFMPFCLWASAIFVPNLSRQSRLFLLKTAFETFFGFYVQCIEQKKIAEVTTNACLTSVAVCFAQKYFMIRCLNSTMAAIYALNNFPEVGLDRLGTHCLEQYFGNVRSMCHGYDSYENIIKNCVKTLQNMNACAKYNISNTTHGRINMAGAKMHEKENDETIHLDGIDSFHPQLVAAAFFGLVGEVGLKFNEVGGPFGQPPPNDPDQVALSEALLRCKQSISQIPSDQKMIALQYFEGDDRAGAVLDIVNEWSYQIPKTYKKGNNSNSNGAKIFVRSISVSADEAQNQIKLHEQTFPQSVQQVQKKRGRPRKKNQFLPSSAIQTSLHPSQIQQIAQYQNSICNQKLENFQTMIKSLEEENEESTQASNEESTQAPNEESTQSPNEESTQASNEESTQAPTCPNLWDVISPYSKYLIERHVENFGHDINSINGSIPLCFDCTPVNQKFESFQAIANFGMKKKAYKFLSMAKPTKYDDVVKEFVPNPDEILGQ